MLAHEFFAHAYLKSSAVQRNAVRLRLKFTPSHEFLSCKYRFY